MQAHVLANLIPDERPSFRSYAWTVSGGHTQIVRCDSPTWLTVIGETIDDAAEKPSIKPPRCSGSPIPAARSLINTPTLGNLNRFTFPEPQIAGLDFSFSGLKTSILYF